MESLLSLPRQRSSPDSERWVVAPNGACVAFRGRVPRFVPAVSARFTR